MRLYLSPDGVWTGTQADAKAHAKANATTWKEVEVPVDKAGLMVFLNGYKVGAAGPVGFLAPPPAPLPLAPAEPIKTVTLPAVPAPVRTVPLAIQSIPLEEAILELPLHEAVRLGGIVMERIRDFAKKAV